MKNLGLFYFVKNYKKWGGSLVQLYTNNKQDITKNGIILNPISGKISPKLNGENELEMEVFLDEDGIYKNIKDGCLITVPTPDFEEDQAYRIYDTVKNMSSNTMTVYARHIQFDLNKKVIFNKNVQGNGQQVLTELLEGTNFTGTSDSNLTDIRQYKMRNVTNVISGNEADSFLNIWGGEIECNNYNLSIPLKRTKDRGLRITFGYNLDDIEEDLNSDEIVTRIYPYSGDLVLSGNMPYVDSPLISKYQDVCEQSIEMSDIKVKERTYDSDGKETTSKDAEGFNTREEAEAEMIKRCEKLFSEGADKIKANYKVKMQSLSKTQEYKRLGYDVLEKVCLGDTVQCYNKNIDIEVSARCISYQWDIVNKEFIEIELGQFISSYIDNQLNDLDNLYRKIVLEKQYILLRVDSLDNTMHSEIKITEDKIHSEVVNTTLGLQSQITQTASEIRSEVTNTASGLQSQITQQAGQISSTVTRVGEAESNITQLADDITSKVSKGDFSTLIKQNAEAVAIAIKGETDMNVVFDSNGQLIKNGALEVQDDSGRTLLYFDNDKGILGTRDISISDTSKGSGLYNALMSMDECYIPDLGVGTLYINHKSVEQIVYDMLVEYNLV